MVDEVLFVVEECLRGGSDGLRVGRTPACVDPEFRDAVETRNLRGSCFVESVDLLIADDAERRCMVGNERAMRRTPIGLELVAGQVTKPPEREDDPLSHVPVLVGVCDHE